MEEGTGIQSILKIAVVGVESTGKTSLCKALAEAYDTAYTVEVAREYLMTHGKRYKSIDLEKISELQLAEEDEKTFILRYHFAGN
jgi:nicotinamide riboside kinase